MPLPNQMEPMIPISGKGFENFEEANARSMHINYEDSLNPLNTQLNLKNQKSSTYCHIKDNDSEHNYQPSEVNTDAFTPNMKVAAQKGRKQSDMSEGVPLLEKLKGHPSKTEHVYNSATKRMNKILTCLYPGCEKTFNKTWNILDHFKVHTGEKPYQCRN